MFTGRSNGLTLLITLYDDTEHTVFLSLSCSCHSFLWFFSCKLFAAHPRAQLFRTRAPRCEGALAAGDKQSLYRRPILVDPYTALLLPSMTKLFESICYATSSAASTVKFFSLSNSLVNHRPINPFCPTHGLPQIFPISRRLSLKSANTIFLSTSYE